MITLGSIQEILGWCSVINIGLLIFSSVTILAMRGPIVKIHSKMYFLSEEDLSRAYFQYLAQFKIAVIVFNIVPYIALRIVA
jgi:hypothetical protein